MPLLSVERVTRRFGGIVALDDVSLDANAGEIVGLIGPNGAGKTTVFNLITRVYRPDSGAIELDGTDLLRTPAHRIVRRGVARTFQNVELFGSMTVLEHVLVGRHAHRGRSAREILGYVGLAGARAPARARASVRDPEARRAGARARLRARACCSSTSRREGSTTRRSSGWRP